MVLLLYPIFSAFTQELLFRRFFFWRYEEWFGAHTTLLIIVNALIFGYVHIVFENWIAVVFSTLGGFLFAHTYHKTRSTLLVTVEHALYGDLLFTLGLGMYFYHGTVN